MCVSVTSLASTYLVCKSQVRDIRFFTAHVLCGFSRKILCSPVLASFAHGRVFDEQQ